MKKVYLMALAALFGTTAMAQVDVTFQVDMNGETVSPNGVHVAGSWQGEANGDDADWQPGANMMTDDDADGIYTLTVNIPAGEYQYKFINDNNWGQDETQIPAEVTIGGNRFFAITSWHETDGFVLPAVTFNGAAPAGFTAVRLNVDMANFDEIDPMGVHVAGDVITPNWTPEYGTCTNTGSSVYSYVTYVDAPGTYAYKFLNGNSFFGPNESVPADCGDGSGNRTVEVGTETVATPTFCYGACEPCTEPVSVTFRVNMSLEEVSVNGVHVAGNWQAAAGFASDWTPGNSPMNDLGDGIWELAVTLPPGSYQYKFVNGNDWGTGGEGNLGDESVPGECNEGGNRFFTAVAEEPLVLTNCFAQCSEECVENPNPANITFQVDMNAQTVSENGVFVMGSYSVPQWQAGATPMADDDGDGIYEATILIDGPADFQFKFTNGDPFPGGVADPAVEETHDFATDGCGVDNGIGGFNRTHTRSGVDETLGFVYNSCESILSTQDLELGRVAIFPNPSEGVSFLEVENPNGHVLRMNIVDITGKVIKANEVLNSTRYEINTSDLNSGLYFLDIVNESNERAVFKLMVK